MALLRLQWYPGDILSWPTVSAFHRLPLRCPQNNQKQSSGYLNSCSSQYQNWCTKFVKSQHRTPIRELNTGSAAPYKTHSKWSQVDNVPEVCAGRPCGNGDTWALCWHLRHIALSGRLRETSSSHTNQACRRGSTLGQLMSTTLTMTCMMLCFVS